jgi:hypothetical protein
MKDLNTQIGSMENGTFSLSQTNKRSLLVLSWRENVGYNPTVRNGDFYAAIRNRLYFCIKLQNERASLFLAN